MEFERGAYAPSHWQSDRRASYRRPRGIHHIRHRGYTPSSTRTPPRLHRAHSITHPRPRPEQYLPPPPPHLRLLLLPTPPPRRERRSASSTSISRLAAHVYSTRQVSSCDGLGRRKEKGVPNPQKRSLLSPKNPAATRRKRVRPAAALAVTALPLDSRSRWLGRSPRTSGLSRATQPTPDSRGTEHLVNANESHVPVFIRIRFCVPASKLITYHNGTRKTKMIMKRKIRSAAHAAEDAIQAPSSACGRGVANRIEDIQLCYARPRLPSTLAAHVQTRMPSTAPSRLLASASAQTPHPLSVGSGISSDAPGVSRSNYGRAFCPAVAKERGAGHYMDRRAGRYCTYCSVVPQFNAILFFYPYTNSEQF
ncbi:hypothetical protein K438DRAFT_2022876 [Mycena galopus ATCC 62051]|nr:hypothetical protein K438DRAFT_2022876 [Mycena galopus ATCC 62051]